MRNFARILSAAALLSIGYVLGATHMVSAPPVAAQQAGPDQEQLPTDEARTALKTLNSALTAAAQQLTTDGRYQSGTTGVNSFAVLVGGVNVIDDLETGRGVDPETFAALYAGLADENVAPHLARDEEGRLTYKNKLVRMYPISRLKRLFATRNELAGIETRRATP